MLQGYWVTDRGGPLHVAAEASVWPEYIDAMGIFRATKYLGFQVAIGCVAGLLVLGANPAMRLHAPQAHMRTAFAKPCDTNRFSSPLVRADGACPTPSTDRSYRP